MRGPRKLPEYTWHEVFPRNKVSKSWWWRTFRSSRTQGLMVHGEGCGTDLGGACKSYCDCWCHRLTLDEGVPA